MRIALDATYALEPQPSGVARYSQRLIRELGALPEVDLTLCARWPAALRLRRQFAGARFRSCWLQEPLNCRLPRAVDLFHGLNQRLPRYRFRRQVVTVHDVFPLSSPAYSTPEFRRRFAAMIHDAVTRADRIICVSAYTRGELCRNTEVKPEQCVVVHHGVEQDPPPPGEELRRQARGLTGEGSFLLSVGAVQVRKNTLAAVEALELLPGKSARLVVAGSMGHGSEEIRRAIESRGLGDRVRLLGYIPEPLLDALYAEASLLLFPSLEEGFGFPVLEAMARGLPVIASNASSIPEIAGGAAVLLDPRDVEGMARETARLLEDGAWRAELAARGLAQARAFTWQCAARATLDVYRSLR